MLLEKNFSSNSFEGVGISFLPLTDTVVIFNEDTKDFNKLLSTLRPHMVDMLLLVE